MSTDHSAWYGADLAATDSWIERLTHTEIREVERAISAKNVQLPTLAPRLQRILDEVLNGRGFVLIRGLPIEGWTKREAAEAFLTIGAQLGTLRMQNAEGHLLGHVRDLGR